MKEIGGYLELEKLIHREYYPDLLALNNARNSLLYILKAKKIKKLYIPYYLCESVENICKKNNFEYECYSIDKEFVPIFDKALDKEEYIYIVNFFGQISNKKVQELKKIYKNIIFDNVQAFFQRPVKGVDTIYSCRKFFGVPDGAYVSTEVNLNEDISVDVSKDRMVHILGRFEGNASNYYQDFKNNDKLFENTEMKLMSKLTHNILGAIDYDKVIQIRNSNYAVLNKKLGEINKLNLTTPIAPYMYPFYFENGMELKKVLSQKNIFVPTLWPNVLKYDRTIEKDFAENIVPLPVDQRYSVSEMNYVVEEVLKCIN